MMPFIRRLACALVPALAACGSDLDDEYRRPPPLPLRGEALDLRRLSSPALEIFDPGVLVIRDTAAWRTLWTRYRKDPAEVPVVNFKDLMVVAVSRGSGSGCVNSAIYVERVERGRDSLFVVLDPGSGGPEVTCAMEIGPVDLVAVPRSDLPIAWVEYPGRRGPPPPARWLDPNPPPPPPRVAGPPE
jgi:hypothetical protein